VSISAIDPAHPLGFGLQIVARPDPSHNRKMAFPTRLFPESVAWIVRRFACGKSTASNSTFDSLELKLLEGRLRVKDLPEAWRTSMRLRLSC
jgi:hypothetical protein